MSSEEWGAGNRDNWSDHGTVTVGKQEYPLVYGEHPHSRQDNRHYIDLGKDREPVGFDGHRVLIGVQIESSNYFKESHYSGDEVRKGGSAKILADGEVVFEFFHRDTQWALLRAHSLIGQLREHESGWMIRKERERLPGRLVSYREHPAVIDYLIVDQGCLILKTEDGQPFPAPAWARDEGYGYEASSTAKVEVTDPHIWWFRKEAA